MRSTKHSIDSSAIFPLEAPNRFGAIEVSPSNITRVSRVSYAAASQILDNSGIGAQRHAEADITDVTERLAELRARGEASVVKAAADRMDNATSGRTGRCSRFPLPSARDHAP